MTKDISRLLSQTKKHYAGARLQQGRVLLDSDLNESARLGEEDRRRFLVDALGPQGSPDQGFTLRQPVDIADDQTDVLHLGDLVVSRPVSFNGGAAVNVLPLALRPGSVYAGGLRFDLDDPEPLAFQRDFLQMQAADAPTLDSADPSFRHLYYLEAWEQCVTPLEDEELVEAMLRGSDTSVRVRRMRRVRRFDASAVEPPTCSDAWAELVEELNQGNASFDARTHELRSNGRLQLAFKGGEAADPCSPVDPFGKRYLGAENQTLRVMLTSDITYVWALDNATPLFKVKVTGLDVDPPTDVRVTILNPPTDERSWPFKNRVVEIIPFGALLDGGNLFREAGPHFRKAAAEMGVFTRAAETYDPVTRSFPIELSAEIGNDLRELVHQWSEDHPDHEILREPDDAAGARFFYMRLWHDALTADDVEIATSDEVDGPALGDTGIVPVFHADGRAGDHWVATLRVDAPAEVQPLDLLADGGVPPHGPRRFFAPLALLGGQGAGTAPPQATVSLLRDCRPRLRPLAERCPTLTVGDGEHSFGDFTSISEALDALPDEGGIIAVRPGVYLPPVTISGRRNVTIEGCGEATIIESAFSDGFGVIVIEDSQDVHIASLRIHAGDERGIVVRNESSNVTIDDVHVITGTLGSGVFQPGAGPPIGPQVVVFEGSHHVTFNSVTLEPNRQSALQLFQAFHVTVTNMTVQGMTGDDDGLFVPLCDVLSSTDFVMTESSLVSLGQVPLRLSAVTNGELSGLSIRSQARATPVTFTTNLYSAVCLDLCRHVRLRKSSVAMQNQASEQAAVMVHGTDVTVEDCTVVAEGGDVADAWGGIQIRGGTSGVRLVGNRIQGGYGHGITIGSVGWHSFNQSRVGIEGPGRGQTEGSSGAFSVTGFLNDFVELGSQFSPADDGPVAGLVIAGNRVEGMATNGISVLTVTGTGPAFFLIEVDGARIERNVVTRNVLRPSNSSPDVDVLPFPTSLEGPTLAMSVLPVGGIVLGTALNTHIRGNTIVNNALGQNVLPVNGIFVLTGDSLCIEDNRIVRNGSRAEVASPSLRAGVRAGIAVMLAGAGSPVNEEGIDAVLGGQTTLDNGGVALRVSGNSVLHPEGRALHVVGTGPFQIEGNFLASLGNQGADDRVEQYAIGELVYVQNLGGPFESRDLQAFISSSEDGLSNFVIPRQGVQYLLDTVPASPRLFLGAGGQIQFNNNHTVLDWQVVRPPTQGAPLSYFPVVLFTQDHVGLLGNHLALRVEGATEGFPRPFPSDPNDQAILTDAFAFQPVFSHVFAAGMTANVQFNRFSENVRATYLSLMSNGDLLNYSAYNQATHDIFAIATTRETRPEFVQPAPEQVLYAVHPGVHRGDAFEVVRRMTRTFLALTFAFNR
jgi:hypothetical protein